MNAVPYQYVRAEQIEGVLVVTITVDQIRDATRGYTIRDEILAAIETHQANDLVLDLGQLSFIGSIGFMAFLSVRRQLSAGRIILCKMSGPVRDLFAICHLIATDPAKKAPFEVAETVAAAVESVAKGG